MDRLRQTVLLLDDCATIRAILKVYLMKVGREFVEAEDAATALMLLRRHPIDLVIADVRMVPMDGIAFVRNLRSDPSQSLRDVPVILLTSDLDEALRAQGLAAGADAFVHKPISPPALEQAVRGALERAAELKQATG